MDDVTPPAPRIKICLPSRGNGIIKSLFGG